MNWNLRLKGPGLLLASLTVVYSNGAFAADSSAGILDSVLDSYKDIASTWSTTLLADAAWLFWGLMVISLVWTFGTMALKGGGLQEALAEMIRFFAVGGFFLYILQHGPAISMSIIDTCRDMAANAIGGRVGLSPSGIVDIGFDIFNRIIDQSSVWSPVSSACGMLIGLAVLVTLALVGVNMLLLMVSSWILCYGGIIFLGFGGGRWTSEMAINFYKSVLNLGMQLFGMSLVIGIGQSFIDKYYNAMNAAVSLKDMAVLLVCCIVLLVLTNKIPPLLGNLAGGHGGGAGGIGNFGASMAMAAAATGAALAASGMAHAASGASAVKEAIASAQQHLASGGGASDGGDSGGDIGGYTQSSGDSSSYGPGPDGNEKGGSMFAQAMGTAGRASDSAFSRAGRTSPGPGRADLGSVTSSDRLDTGVSGASQTSHQRSATERPVASQFDGNGIGPGKPTSRPTDTGSSRDDEIAAFVNSEV